MIEKADVTEDKQEKVKGRPKKTVDETILRNLCEIQCTVKEIAYVMGVSVDTLNRNYKDVINEGRSQGKIALRRAQWRSAIETKNVTMQIFLGKAVLHQRDTPLDTEDNQILPWTD